MREVRKLKAAIGDLDATSRANLKNVLDRKEFEFSESLIKAHGIVVDALANTEIVTPGESLDVTVNVYLNLAKGPENGGAKSQIKLLAPAGWKIEQLPSDTEQGAGPQQGMRQRERPDELSRVR